MTIRLETPSEQRLEDFLTAVHRSRALHRGRTSPPASAAEFHSYLARVRSPSHIGHLLIDPDDAVVGVVNVNEIVRGSFQSASLGYYIFAPFERRGFMTAGVKQVVDRVFRQYKLHRVEANIAPDNVPSLRIAEGLGFRREGFSPRYLKIAGRWQDHERWALTKEDWQQTQYVSGALAPTRGESSDEGCVALGAAPAPATERSP